MCIPAWFDALFELLTSRATWSVIGVVIALLAAWMWATWNVLKAWVARG